MNIYSDKNDNIIVGTGNFSDSAGNLDRWDGHNRCSGTGIHRGLDRLTKGKFSGRYVLVHTTQWIGGRDYAEIISDDEALQLFLETTPRGFPDLEKMAGELAAN